MTYIGRRASLTQATFSAGYASALDQVFVTGGDPGGNTVFKYDVATDAWSSLPSMITNHQAHPCVFVFNDILYTAAGYYAGSRVSSMESLDLANPSAVWKSSISLPYGVSHTACAAINDTVILAGGVFHGSNPTTAWKWVVGTASWVPVSPLLRQRTYHCAVAVPPHDIFVLGGHGGGVLTLVERYDITRDVWQNMSPMPGPTHDHACIYINGNIIVAGGDEGYGPVNPVYVYNVDSDQWTNSNNGLQAATYRHQMGYVTCTDTTSTTVLSSTKEETTVQTTTTVTNADSLTSTSPVMTTIGTTQPSSTTGVDSTTKEETTVQTTTMVTDALSTSTTSSVSSTKGTTHPSSTTGVDSTSRTATTTLGTSATDTTTEVLTTHVSSIPSKCQSSSWVV